MRHAQLFAPLRACSGLSLGTSSPRTFHIKFARVLAIASLAISAQTWAQTSTATQADSSHTANRSPSLSALDPAAPTQPLVHTPLVASAGIANEATDWKAANAAVARFPRGHADVVKWEKANAGKSDASKPVHQHGGQP